MSVAAQFCLKAGMSSASVKAALALPTGWHTIWAVITHYQVVIGLILYGLSAVVWLAVLTQWDVSKAYPMVGLGFAFTLLIAALTGEQVTLMRGGGVFLICAGVVLVARS